jgi:hypothetical protein
MRDARSDGSEPLMREAPFTLEEVNSFNEFQECGLMHPFTCGLRGNHAEGLNDILVAREDGLHCPTCEYIQNWAHEWMMDGKWSRAVDDINAAMKSL